MWQPLQQIKESLSQKLTSYAAQEVQGRVRQLEDDNWLLQESLSRLELEIENEGYYRITQLSEYKFDRQRLIEIVRLAVQMAIKNPITNRSVNVQADYVFGRGVRFTAKSPQVQEWVDEFVQYRENRKALTSGPAMRRQERQLQIEGNLFAVLFTNFVTGRVTVRLLNIFEVQDVIRDPEDYQRELYVRRTYQDAAGHEHSVYHPVLWVDQKSGVQAPWAYSKQGDIPLGEIDWSAPILPISFNKFGKEKFAVPEIYPQLDWALAYKRTLEDYTSIIRSFARMALKITGLTGKKQAAATKNMLQSTVSLANPIEKNPSGTASQIPLMGKGVDIEAVKTAGATTPPSEFSPVLDMASTGAGLPSYLYGNSSKADKVLDRPTEIKMIARQNLWEEVFNEVFAWVVYVRGVKEYGWREEVDPFNGAVRDVPKWPADFDPRVESSFPELMERNVTDRVRALVNAVTLFGKQITDIIPDKRLVARLLLEALLIPDVDKRVEGFVTMWEKNMKAEPGKPVDAVILPPPPPPGGAGAEDPSQGGDLGANG